MNHQLRLSFFGFLVLCGLCCFSVVNGQEEGDGDPLCGAIYTSPRASKSKDPIAELGGIQNIDKIIKIDVDTAHNLFFCTDNRVIGKMTVT